MGPKIPGETQPKKKMKSFAISKKEVTRAKVGLTGKFDRTFGRKKKSK